MFSHTPTFKIRMRFITTKMPTDFTTITLNCIHFVACQLDGNNFHESMVGRRDVRQDTRCDNVVILLVYWAKCLYGRIKCCTAWVSWGSTGDTTEGSNTHDASLNGERRELGFLLFSAALDRKSARNHKKKESFGFVQIPLLGYRRNFYRRGTYRGKEREKRKDVKL